MTHISVHEWGRVAVSNGSEQGREQLSRAQANALIGQAKAHPLGGEEGTAILCDHYRHLSARQMVGMIAASGCSLEILPKVDPADGESDASIRRRLVHMLDVALDLGIGDISTASLATQGETLLDILIRIFADRLLAEARRGLPRAYLAEDAVLPVLRGRLDVIRQFTAHAARADRLACRFDALSPDTPLMQVMKCCVGRLRAHARIHETMRRLDELRMLLVDVTDIPMQALPWAAVILDRTNRGWQSLYRLARLLLHRQWQATHHAHRGVEGVTLLFPMNDLFESYVAALMRRAVRGTGFSVQVQGGGLFCLIEEGGDRRQRFQTRPDLLIKRGGQTCLIIDTKWKRLAPDIEDRKRGINQADVYQMMAYGRLYGCANLVLLYPHHAGLGIQELDIGYGVAASNDRLRVATVDLANNTGALATRMFGLLDAEGVVASLDVASSR